MILAVDVGNTNVVICGIEDGFITETFRFKTDPESTVEEYAAKLRAVIDDTDNGIGNLEGAVIASVVPPVTPMIEAAIRELTGIDALVVGQGINTDLNISIDEPETLGADLAVAGTAAAELYHLPCIVIDMGTATTITVIDRNRSFVGGAIIPGVKLSFSALIGGASMLQETEISVPQNVIGKNTADCLKSGAVFASASMIDGMLERMMKEIGEECTVIATGGLASLVIPYCIKDIIIDDTLIFKGLWIMWNKNK